MKLHVEVQGHGPDLVLIHGWGYGGAVWREFAARLTRQFRVHCVDLPGYGGSAMCKPCALDQVVERIAHSVPQRVIACGWSLGAQLALGWALQQPRQVDRLILIAATPRFVRNAEWTHGMSAHQFADFARRVHHDSRKALKRFAVLQSSGDTHARMVSRRLMETLASGNLAPAALGAGLRLLEEIDLRGCLGQVEQAVLLVHGCNDALVPSAAAQYLQAQVRAATLQLLSDTGHAPFVAQTERTARYIEEFCGE